MIEPTLALGIKILAYIHSGELSLSCEDCQDKDKLYCSGVSETPIITHDDMGEFYSCPVKWITQPIYEWYDEYKYYIMFEGTAPTYLKCSMRWCEVCSLYKTTYDKSVSNKMNKKENSPQQTTTNLAKLRGSFKNKRNK